MDTTLIGTFPRELSPAKRRVLCVQPNEDLHPALLAALSKCVSLVAVSATSARRAIVDGSFDAYVLDFWLPDWTGCGLCREIRQADPHVPIVFFSIANGDDRRRRALRAGADAYVAATDGAARVAEHVEKRLQHIDAGSLDALAAEERAIEEELRRRAGLAIATTEFARARAAEATERAARLRAERAFVSANGTLANLHRWWPAAYDRTSAEGAERRTVPIQISTEDATNEL